MHKLWGMLEAYQSDAGMACLDEVLLEQDLDDFLQDGQQPRVVHSHSALQHWQQSADLQETTMMLSSG